MSKIEEIFLPVPNYEGLYEISNFGRVKSLPKYTPYSHQKETIIMKPITCKNGYLEVKLCNSGKCKRFLIHRLVALAHLSNPDKKPHVNHIDSNRHNNNLVNLEWCTRKENTQHGMAHGNIKQLGVYNVKTVLNEEKVREIRLSNEDSFTLADKYGVCSGHINNIRRYKSWKHVCV